MKKIISMVAGLLLAIGVGVTLPATSASAHQHSAGTYWVCGATREHPTDTVFHSWPYYMVPGHIVVWCRDANDQWFVQWNTDGTYYRISGYQDCNEVVCLGPSGH